MAAILKNYVRLSHIDSFKAAWDTCDNKTILKHLDNQVALIPGLREQELNGVWKVHEVPCSAGNYTEGDYEEWRRWRNKQSDSTVPTDYSDVASDLGVGGLLEGLGKVFAS